MDPKSKIVRVFQKWQPRKTSGGCGRLSHTVGDTLSHSSLASLDPKYYRKSKHAFFKNRSPLAKLLTPPRLHHTPPHVGDTLPPTCGRHTPTLLPLAPGDPIGLEPSHVVPGTHTAELVQLIVGTVATTAAGERHSCGLLVACRRFVLVAVAIALAFDAGETLGGVLTAESTLVGVGIVSCHWHWSTTLQGTAVRR